MGQSSNRGQNSNLRCLIIGLSARLTFKVNLPLSSSFLLHTPHSILHTPCHLLLSTYYLLFTSHSLLSLQCSFLKEYNPHIYCELAVRVCETTQLWRKCEELVPWLCTLCVRQCSPTYKPNQAAQYSPLWMWDQSQPVGDYDLFYHSASHLTCSKHPYDNQLGRDAMQAFFAILLNVYRGSVCRQYRAAY